jgi:inhibitor of KinA sporulation pathway (predicted exonuclease)
LKNGLKYNKRGIMSNVDLSRLLVIDLEGTCWENMPRQEQEQNTEIIQIGITQINLVTKRIEKTKSYFIKPVKTEISKYCELLTGITPELIEKEGIALTRASKLIRNEFPTTRAYWGSWGDDHLLLKRDCDDKKAVMPFSERFLNYQELYSMKNGLLKPVSLRNAMETHELQFRGTQHRADDDSFNTAKLILKVFV